MSISIEHITSISKAFPSNAKPIKLTDKQGEVLEFIDAEIKADPYGKSPKLRWIASQLGMMTSNAWEYASQLRANGCLSGEPDRRRSLSVTEIGRATLERAEQVRQEQIAEKEESEASLEAAAQRMDKEQYEIEKSTLKKKKMAKRSHVKKKKKKKKSKKSKSSRK